MRADHLAGGRILSLKSSFLVCGYGGWYKMIEFLLL